MAQAPRELSPEEAAKVLKKALSGHRGDLTVADAAARAGLSLRAAERGLFFLLERYPSNLKATSEGELLFSFPKGLSRPRKELSPVRRFLKKTGKVLAGIGRFLVRAWISIVLIGYALIFLAVILALAFSGRDSEDRGNVGFGAVYILFRLVAEALFWTIHPFSPFAVYYHDPAYGRPERSRRRKKKEDVPFYEKVNRFIFGPAEPEPDPREQERRILAEIRRQRGRIGVLDVMRVTGLSREAAEPLLARLMLDYEGEVEVSDEGGITYHFPKLRKTAGLADEPGAAPPAWQQRLSVPPLTGNSPGMNFLIAGLNAFNLVMSLIALGAGLTLERLTLLLQGIPLEAMPPDGTPIALGLIPFAFSLTIFALPLGRAILRPKKKREIARENGRRGLLRAIVQKVEGVKEAGSDPLALDEAALRRAWQEFAGELPDDKELVREALKLGAEVEISASGRAIFRFRDLEAEVAALKEERERAGLGEEQVGEVVFRAEEISGRGR